MEHFRESASYREYRESHSAVEDVYSDCCQGEPIGECHKCGERVCEDHGVLDNEGDTWCLEHAPEPVEITPLQVVALAELAGVAL